MAFLEDIHAIRQAQEAMVAEAKVANEHRKAMADSLAAIAVAAKKLAGDEVVGIVGVPGPPTTH